MFDGFLGDGGEAVNGGGRHAAAQRNRSGHLLGCLHRCLATGRHYDQTIAFPAAPEKTSPGILTT